MKYPKVWGGPNPVGEALVRGLQMTGQPFLSAQTADGTWAGAMNGFYEVRGEPPETSRLVFEPVELTPQGASGLVYPSYNTYGRPFSDAGGAVNPPLGTVGGDDQVWRLSVGKSSYSRRRGNPRNYGLRNWIKGATVISWKGPSSRLANELQIVGNLTPFGRSQFDVTYSPSDDLPDEWFVLGARYKLWRQLKSTKVFHRFEVLLDTAQREDMEGYVCGAAKHVAESGAISLMVVTLTGFISPTFRAYRVALFGQGAAELLHTASPGAGYYMDSDWYFDSSGENACCTFSLAEDVGGTLATPGTIVGKVRGSYSIEGGFSFTTEVLHEDIPETTEEIVEEGVAFGDMNPYWVGWHGGLPATYHRQVTTSIPEVDVPVAWDYDYNDALCELRLRSPACVVTDRYDCTIEWVEDEDYNAHPNNENKPKYDPATIVMTRTLTATVRDYRTELVITGGGTEVSYVLDREIFDSTLVISGSTSVPFYEFTGSTGGSSVPRYSATLNYCSIRDGVLIHTVRSQFQTAEVQESQVVEGSTGYPTLTVSPVPGTLEDVSATLLLDGGKEARLHAEEDTRGILFRGNAVFVPYNTAGDSSSTTTSRPTITGLPVVNSFIWQFTEFFTTTSRWYSVTATKYKGVVLANVADYDADSGTGATYTYLSGFGDVRSSLLRREDQKFVLHNIGVA